MPVGLKVHPYFGSTRQFIVEGFVPATASAADDDKPRYVFRDHQDKTAIDITFNLQDGTALVTSEFNFVRATAVDRCTLKFKWLIIICFFSSFPKSTS